MLTGVDQALGEYSLQTFTCMLTGQCPKPYTLVSQIWVFQKPRTLSLEIWEWTGSTIVANVGPLEGEVRSRVLNPRIQCAAVRVICHRSTLPCIHKSFPAGFVFLVVVSPVNLCSWSNENPLDLRLRRIFDNSSFRSRASFRFYVGLQFANCVPSPMFETLYSLKELVHFRPIMLSFWIRIRGATLRLWCALSHFRDRCNSWAYLLRQCNLT